MSLFRIAFAVAALLCASCASPEIRRNGRPARPRAKSEKPIDRTAILVGQRQLDEDVWQPVENQPSIGIEFSSISASTGTGFEVGLGASRDDAMVGATKVDVTMLEFFGGLRVQRPHGTVRPFAGLGGVATYVDAEIGFAPEANAAISLGGYVHGGIHFEISEDVDLVLEVRKRVGEDVDLSGAEIDIDYLTFAAGLSF